MLIGLVLVEEMVISLVVVLVFKEEVINRVVAAVETEISLVVAVINTVVSVIGTEGLKEEEVLVAEVPKMVIN